MGSTRYTEGEPEAIVLLHGAVAAPFKLVAAGAVFARASIAVTFDHRGFRGQSPDTPRPWQPTGLRRGSQPIARSRIKMERVALVAQSMGRRTCLGLTLAHPAACRRLVMADTTGGASPMPPRMAQLALRARSLDDRAESPAAPCLQRRHFPEQPAPTFL